MLRRGNLKEALMLSRNTGVRPRDGSMLSYLREMCDKYFDPSYCNPGAGSTRFHIDGIDRANCWAELALNIYNEKEQKNFYLEKVAQLNVFVTFHFLTFWARTAENAEGLLFRGVVNMQKGDILLCEIKGGDEMAIPDDHSEKCRLQHSRRSDYHVRNSSSGGSVAASVFGHGCVDPGKVDGFCPLGHSMLWALRDLCDTYFDQRDCDPGAGISHIYFDRREKVNFLAELSLEFYNDKEQKRFYLEEVCKLNVFFAYYALTFWARTAGSHDRTLFRGVVHVMVVDSVVLCEIKDDGEITIPVDHSENCRLKCSRIDDDEAKDTADGSVVASSGAAVGCGGVDLGKVDGVRPMDDDSTFSLLRELCDKYFDPCDSSPGAGITRFNIPGIEFVNELAESALEFYNQKDKKKFYFEAVGQLNLFLTYYCLTFRAWAAGSDELYLFRGVVDVLGGVNVVLCEIKDVHAITSPVDNSENCGLKRSRIDDYNANETSIRSVDASSGKVVACVGVDLGKVDGVRPRDGSMLSYLREMCDKYFDPSYCNPGAGSTRFHIDGIDRANCWAELALKIYNEKEQKNFYLEKVAQLNVFVTFHFLTFWARTAESAEGLLFRGAVNMQKGDILLCEIKGGDEMAIPDDHSVKCRLQRSRRSDYHVRNSSSGGSVGASFAAHFGHGCVDPGKVDGFLPLGHSMLWALRDLCDTYFDQRDCDPGAGMSHIYFDKREEVNFLAELSLEFYNDKEQKSFYLEEVCKLNVFFAYYALTFWARTAESHDRTLFRGVVHVMVGDSVVLCEIKDDGEITIPVDHSENCRLKCSRIDDDEAKDTTDGSVVAHSGAAVGCGGVDLGKVDGVRPMDDDSTFSLLRELCDKYFDPCDSSPGAGITRFHIPGIEFVNELAESALEFYNQKDKKKFYFEKVGQLNLFLTYYCLTFWARAAGSDERCLFRGVVDVLGGVTVVLCEIKDGNAITIPVDSFGKSFSHMFTD
ncbi:uncharacterized protein [Primulina eburnea]|uniref:uncharacterized protein isoform X4 n=1 Tax=Primulina eburnea TaxID=1245227 RepID=UPI003C6C9EED